LRDLYRHSNELLRENLSCLTADKPIPFALTPSQQAMSEAVRKSVQEAHAGRVLNPYQRMRHGGRY
jgi:hypothetical protein